MAFPFCKGVGISPPFFDGARVAAGGGGVKAAHSAPVGLGLDGHSSQAMLHQIKNGGMLIPVQKEGGYVAMTDRCILIHHDNKQRWLGQTQP